MKKIEERIEELETMVYQSKNVLTFNEASKSLLALARAISTSSRLPVSSPTTSRLAR